MKKSPKDLFHNIKKKIICSTILRKRLLYIGYIDKKSAIKK